jgi:hypothetical protein
MRDVWRTISGCILRDVSFPDVFVTDADNKNENILKNK